MNFGLKSVLLTACFCVPSVLVSAQATPCAAEGGASGQGSVIGCVTGAGVEIKGTVNIINNGTDSPGPEGVALPPDQRPAIVPVVTYANGKLTIVAKNSTLSDILAAVGEKTGAAIDIPEDATERVVSELGPGPAREVVAALLNGSHFNYVMVGTETNPNSVARVILTAKTETKDAPGSPNTLARAGFPTRPAMPQAAMRPYQEMQQQVQPQAQPAPPPDPQPVAVEQPAPSPAQDQASPANSAQVTTSSGVAEAAVVEPPQPVSGGTSNNASGSGEKSPQQVLQDLYEARRQMIQAQRQPPQPQ
jgi:hypothetical protein